MRCRRARYSHGISTVDQGHHGIYGPPSTTMPMAYRPAFDAARDGQRRGDGFASQASRSSACGVHEGAAGVCRPHGLNSIWLLLAVP